MGASTSAPSAPVMGGFFPPELMNVILSHASQEARFVSLFVSKAMRAKIEAETPFEGVHKVPRPRYGEKPQALEDFQPKVDPPKGKPTANRLLGVQARLITEAARVGGKDLVVWANKRLNLPYSQHTLNAAAESGNEELFLMLLEEWYVPPTRQTLDHSGFGGNVNILKKLHVEWELAFSTWTVVNAATRGHLDYIQVAKQEYGARCEITALSRALKHGHEAVAEWLIANGTPISTTELAEGVSHCSNDFICKLQSKHNIPYLSAAYAAVELGNLDLLKRWRPRLGPSAWTATDLPAAEAGNLEMVQYMYSSGMVKTSPPRPQSLAAAARGNHRDILQFYHHALHWPMDTAEFLGALEGGNMELIEDLYIAMPRAVEAASTSVSLETVAKNGHLHVFKWLSDKIDLSLSKYRISSAAGMANRVELLAYFLSLFPETGGYTTSWLCDAAAKGYLDIIRLYYPRDLDVKVATAAAEAGQIEIVEHFVREQSYRIPEGNAYTILKAAILAGHTEIFDYCYRYWPSTFRNQFYKLRKLAQANGWFDPRA